MELHLKKNKNVQIDIDSKSYLMGKKRLDFTFRESVGLWILDKFNDSGEATGGKS